MAELGNAVQNEGGPQGNITTQLQCSVTSSADEVIKLLEEKLARQLDGYVLLFNNTEV